MALGFVVSAVLRLARPRSRGVSEV